MSFWVVQFPGSQRRGVPIGTHDQPRQRRISSVSISIQAGATNNKALLRFATIVRTVSYKLWDACGRRNVSNLSEDTLGYRQAASHKGTVRLLDTRSGGDRRPRPASPAPSARAAKGAAGV